MTMLLAELSATPEVIQYTSDDLLFMPDRDRFELVGGQLVERHPSADPV